MLVTCSDASPILSCPKFPLISLSHHSIFSYMAFFRIWYFFIHLCLLTVFFPFSFNWKYIPCRSGILSYLLLCFWYPRGIEEILVSGVNKWGSLFSWHKPHFHLLKAGDFTPFLPACWLAFFLAFTPCLFLPTCWLAFSLAFTDHQTFDISTIPQLLI